ncbi:MAG: LCP family protein [Oscillospiraceae bacterium]|nr:LCP family protein [Oscillospiraceae bacterium]
MGRYKGKREASHSGNKKQIEPAPAWESGSGIGDPFADGGEQKKTGKWRIVLTVILCLAILGTAAGIAVGLWVKEPELPNTENNDQRIADKITAAPSQNPQGLNGLEENDDGLYPDDGYNGDMPEVSGNRKEGVYTFLLVGTDQDDGNTDTIMVVSYDTRNQDISIMSIPRDTMINVSWDIKKINSVYSRYKDGIEALRKEVKKLIGFAPDFYVKVDLKMFVELVDLIGGVEFDVPQDMNYDDPYQDLHIHLNKGVQTLDGEKAMELVRFRRYSEGDIKRVEMQQNFIKALMKECLSIKNWGKIKSYIDLAMENVQTDLEIGSVIWFAANVLGINSGVSALNMDDVYTCTLPGDYWGSAWSRTTGQEQSYVTIYPNEVVKLVNERFNPYEQNVTASMLDAMSILSNGRIASSTGTVRDSAHNSSIGGTSSSNNSTKNSGQTNNKSGNTAADKNAPATNTSKKDDKNSNKNNKTDEPVLPNTSSDTNSNANSNANNNAGSTAKPNSVSSSPNSSGNTADKNEQNNSNTSNNNSSNGGNNGNTPVTITNPTDEPEPQLPDEPPVNPAPEPEPVPVPTPEPEPVIDTEKPEWLG